MSQDSSPPRAFVAALKTPSFILACTIIAMVTLGASYLDEDAFISFRVVDNFVHGHGLRWNIDERVQVYTHPLWVLLLIPLRAIVRDVGVASFVLSLLCSVSAFAVAAYPFRERAKILFVALLLPLLCSQAFTDYLSSGLENPLTFLLLALFVRAAFAKEEGVLSLWLFGALLSLSRPDAILLAAPMMVFAWLRAGKKERILSLTLGLSPLALWSLFSLVYYGVVFPNPKYAKLGGGVSTFRYLELGWGYFRDSLRNDTVTALVLIAALGLGVWLVAKEFVAKGRFVSVGAKVSLLWLGAGGYLLYVISVGGDFMAGRHFAAPFFLACVGGAHFIAALELREEERVLGGFFGAVLFAHFGVQMLAYQRDVIYPREQKRYAVVRAGEIRLQRYNCGFFEALVGARGEPSQHSWSQNGLKAKAKAESAKAKGAATRFVIVDGAAGKTGFYAGPGVTMVDPLGITDPLLGRLPDADGRVKIIGHLERKVPEGYVFARETGSTARMAPPLGRYYEELRLLTSAPLFSTERLSAIVRWNLGKSDGLLKEYLQGARRKVRNRTKAAAL